MNISPYQQLQQVTSQAVQLRIDNAKQATAGFINKSQQHTISNTENIVRRLSSDNQRGQAVDMYA